MVALDHADGEINARRHASGGPEIAVRDEDLGDVEVAVRIARAELRRVAPVGRRAPPAQQAGIGQGEGTKAQARQAARGTGRLPQVGDEIRARLGQADARGDDDRVEGGRLAQRLGLDGGAAPRSKEPARLRQNVDVVGRVGDVSIGHGEGRGHGQAHEIEIRAEHEPNAADASHRGNLPTVSSSSAACRPGPGRSATPTSA